MTNDQLAEIRERRQEATIQMAFAMDEDDVIERSHDGLARLDNLPGMVAEIERLRGALADLCGKIEAAGWHKSETAEAREALKEKPCKLPAN